MPSSLTAALSTAVQVLTSAGVLAVASPPKAAQLSMPTSFFRLRRSLLVGAPSVGILAAASPLIAARTSMPISPFPELHGSRCHQFFLHASIPAVYVLLSAGVFAVATPQRAARSSCHPALSHALKTAM